MKIELLSAMFWLLWLVNKNSELDFFKLRGSFGDKKNLKFEEILEHLLMGLRREDLWANSFQVRNDQIIIEKHSIGEAELSTMGKVCQLYSNRFLLHNKTYLTDCSCTTRNNIVSMVNPCVSDFCELSSCLIFKLQTNLLAAFVRIVEMFLAFWCRHYPKLLRKQAETHSPSKILSQGRQNLFLSAEMRRNCRTKRSFYAVTSG